MFPIPLTLVSGRPLVGKFDKRKVVLPSCGLSGVVSFAALFQKTVTSRDLVASE